MPTITDQLAQALQAVLPYAENEAAAIAELADDGDERDEAETASASAAIDEAHKALAAYDAQRAETIPTNQLAEALRYFSRLSVWPEDTIPPEHMDDDNIAEMADPNAFGEYFITYAAIRSARVAIAEWDAGGTAGEEGAQP